MQGRTPISTILKRHAIVIAVALAALAGGNAATAATESPSFAPNPEDVQQAARDRGLPNRLPDATPNVDGAQVPATVDRPTRQSEGSAVDTGGFPTQSVLIGGSIGAGIGLALAAFVFFGGRRRGDPIST